MAQITVNSRNLSEIRIGSLEAQRNANGTRILRYYIDLQHKTLNLHKELSAPEISILQSKVNILMAVWDEKFATFKTRQNITEGHTVAEQLSIEAAAKLESLRNILSHTLKVVDRVDWEQLKDKKKYISKSQFNEPKPTSQPLLKPTPTASPEFDYVRPKIGFFAKILGRESLILAESQSVYEMRLSVRNAALEKDSEAQRNWEQKEAQRQSKTADAILAWEERKVSFSEKMKREKALFEEQQMASNSLVDKLKDDWQAGESAAIIEHASLVLEASNYLGLFEKSYLIQHNISDGILKIAYDLPTLDSLPGTKAVKFVKATGELVETPISEKDRKANFDLVAYQICLRTIHELFEADEFLNIKSILFNGFANFVDPATGLDKRSCLISVLAERDAFCAIDLSRVEPKACFKSLKGVSAASLASLTPIPPVMNMDTEDRRFVEGREVGSNIDQGTNLASITWEDFEHLVRELFEKEFASRGGEVKITQASRDGGVDAVAFDPDPITGGKIVIQAKRYTKTVGVSAVRDLYGTLMNEGASRGILVTTADYGPDAYNFANGKPLTLMSGSNLLHMMERHGYNAKIDLREAREDMYRDR
jgi:restriction system protein